MSDFDDLERLRLAPEPRANQPRTASGSAAFVGRVTTGTTAPGYFLSVQPIRLLGAREAGTQADPSDMPLAEVPVYLVGPGSPTTGDRLIVRHVPDRWAAGFRETGDQPPVIIQPAGCECFSAPAVLNMTVTYGPGKSSADYFYRFFSTTLTYQAQPAYCIGLDTRYYSPLVMTGFGFNHFYAFKCTSTGGWFMELGDDSVGPMIPGALFTAFSLACSPFLISITGGGGGGGGGDPDLAGIIGDGGTITIS